MLQRNFSLRLVLKHRHVDAVGKQIASGLIGCHDPALDRVSQQNAGENFADRSNFKDRVLVCLRWVRFAELTSRERKLRVTINHADRNTVDDFRIDVGLSQ